MPADKLVPFRLGLSWARMGRVAPGKAAPGRDPVQVGLPRSRVRGAPRASGIWRIPSGEGERGKSMGLAGLQPPPEPPVLRVLQEPLQCRERLGGDKDGADQSPARSSHSGRLREDPIRAAGTALQHHPDAELAGCEPGALGLSGREGLAGNEATGMETRAKNRESRSPKDISLSPTPPPAPSIPRSHQLPSSADPGWCSVSVPCNPEP